MTIIQDYIRDPGRPEFVRRFLAHAASPWKGADAPTLFGTLNGVRVQVVAVMPTGRVGVTEQIGTLSPQRYVALRQLSDLGETLYPSRVKRAARRPVRLDEIFDWFEGAYGVPYADVAATPTRRDCVNARAACVGMHFAVNRYLTIADVARALVAATGIPHGENFVRDIGIRTGLRRKDVDKVDLGYLIAIWRRGPLPVGYEAGQVPREVLRRLQPFVAVCDGLVDALPIAKMRALPWRGASGADPDLFADEPIDADNDNDREGASWAA